MEKLVLGLDIGISSVGWSVIDHGTGKIIDLGVWLFSEGNPEDNLTRRTRRGGRRLLSRRTTRLEDGVHLLKSINIGKSELELCPYEARVKGLEEKLSNEEFYSAYMHLLKRRGSSLETAENDDPDAEKTKGILQGHDKAIANGSYPCVIQLALKRSGQSIRGHENNFRTSHYVAELSKILENQGYSEEVNDKLLELLQRRRDFSEGPGSAISPTPYGRFIKQGDGSIIEINMIEKMIGPCSVYPDELRAPKMSPSAEIFNYLNDLNNIAYVKRKEKLSQLDKAKVMDALFESKNISLTIKQISKLLGVNESDLQGFRINKSEKPIITTMSACRALKEVLLGIDIRENIVPLDEISRILTLEKSIEKRVIELERITSIHLKPSEIDQLSRLKGFSAYHGLSFKVMYEIYPIQIEESMNLMQILSMHEIGSDQKVSMKGLRRIPVDASNIYNPVARRSVRQALKIVNRVRERYGELDSIVVEMPRDRNSSDKRKRINDYQAKNEKKNIMVEEIGGKHLNGNQRLKISLYLEQDGKDLYTGQAIDLKLLLSDDTAFDIDHIIPISVSFDDSMNNKMLTHAKNNKSKANLSPYEAFQAHRFDGWSFETYYTYLFNALKDRKISNKKFELLVMDDSTKEMRTVVKFINRNLVDTQYSSRAVLNTLQEYFKQNNLETTVLTVRGAVTNQFRKRIHLPKDREESFNHHAIDATIIALLSKKKDFYKVIKNVEVSSTEIGVSENNSIEMNEAYFDESFMKILSEVKSIKEVKIGHKVDKKPNRKVADDTIYSTRKIESEKGEVEEFVVKKYKDIYSDEGIKLAKRLLTPDKKDLLMYHHDKDTFDILEGIVIDYIRSFGEIKKENPFSLYKEQNGAIRKFSKKGNGPLVKSVKYYDSKLGNHIDISENYSENGNRVVLLQISPFRTDFYQREDGSYGFVTVRYKDVRYYSETNTYKIDPEEYNEMKLRKKVDSARFMFSLHRGDIVEIHHEKKGKELLRFTATNNDVTNKIDVKPVDYHLKRQRMDTIGKATTLLIKYNQDILGNKYKVNQEELQLEFR